MLCWPYFRGKFTAHERGLQWLLRWVMRRLPTAGVQYRFGQKRMPTPNCTLALRVGEVSVPKLTSPEGAMVMVRGST